MALRDVLAAFKIDVDAKALDGAQKKFGSFLGGLQKVGTALVAGFAGNAVGAFIKGNLDIADTLNDTSIKLGIATDDLERWRYVAQLSGASAEVMDTSLQFLNKALGKAEAGGKDAIGAFAKLGVATKNADGSSRELGDIMPEIAERFGTLGSQGEKTTTAMALFGRGGAALIPMLSQGGAAVQDLIDDFESLGGATSQEFIKAAAETNDQLDRLKRVTQLASQQITAKLLPAFRWLVTEAIHVTKAISDFEKRTGAIERLVKVLAAGAVAGLIVKFVKLAKEAGSVGGAMQKMFGLGPQGMLIVGIIILLALAFEDLWTLLEGGDSLIGQVLDKFLGMGAADEYVQMLKDSWNDILESLGATNVSLEDVMGFFESIGRIAIMAFAGIVQAIAGTIQMFAALIRAAVAAGKIIAEVFKVDSEHDLDIDAVDKQLKEISGAGDSAAKGFDNFGKGFAKVGQGVVGEFGSDAMKAQVKASRGTATRPDLPFLPMSQGAPGGAGGAGSANVSQDNKVVVNQYGVNGENIEAKTKKGLGGGFQDMLNGAKQVYGGR